MLTKKPFSLIEVLIVISVLLILMSLLHPNLKRTLEFARSLVCQKNQKQLLIAVGLYHEDYDGFYPRSQKIYQYDFTYRLSPYIEGEAIQYGFGPQAFNQRSSMIECPSAFYNDTGYLRQNYASNQHVLVPDDPWFNRGERMPHLNVAHFQRPEEHLVFGDATQIHDHLAYLGRGEIPADSNACFYSYRDHRGRSSYVHEDVLNMASPEHREEVLHGFELYEKDGLWQPSYLRFRHLDRSIVGFMDGHTEFFMKGDFKEKHLFTNY